MRMIPYAHQDVDEADVQAVVDVLRSDWITQGPTVGRFERAVADYCGARYALAAINGTAALHLACRMAGLGPQDLLWTSPITFVASANCARMCGADVDFVDIDPRTYNISVESLDQKLRTAAARGRLPKAIMPVHFAGQPCEMEPIGRLARQYGAVLIEDAAHALGARYRGTPVGACEHADAAVFSFHPVKSITTGEGGMVVTQRQDLFDTGVLLRNHGMTRDPRRMDGDAEGPWYYQQLDLGYNYRLPDILAVLGLSQMRRLDEFLARRRALVARYADRLANLPLTLPWQHPDAASAWHIYVVQLQLDRIRKSRREVVEALHAAGVGANVHYIPVHTQPYYRRIGFSRGDFPHAEAYYARAVTLPL
ncbi:MAG: UDP-4-amino-4,6-dideoxy-N-acetyl-beta-L-altrosamine transaminase, partial [bacterium]